MVSMVRKYLNFLVIKKRARDEIAIKVVFLWRLDPSRLIEHLIINEAWARRLCRNFKICWFFRYNELTFIRIRNLNRYKYLKKKYYWMFGKSIKWVPIPWKAIWKETNRSLTELIAWHYRVLRYFLCMLDQRKQNNFFRLLWQQDLSQLVVISFLQKNYDWWLFYSGQFCRKSTYLCPFGTSFCCFMALAFSISI